MRIKSIHIMEDTHQLLKEKQDEIFKNTRVKVSLSELADNILYENTKGYSLH